MKANFELVKLAAERGAVLTTAESCTGGLIAGALTDVPGSSAVVDRGFVTYSNEAKIEMLAVSPATLEAHGAVSTQIAEEMAAGALQRSNANLSISVTGIAGPGGSDHKPEGMVCFGLATADKVVSEKIQFGALGRDQVRAKTVEHALQMLLQEISKTENDRPGYQP